MNSANGRILGIIFGLGFSLALTSCVGYVQGDGGGVMIAEPDTYLFGGYFDGGGARGYGHRGAESRGGHR